MHRLEQRAGRRVSFPQLISGCLGQVGKGGCGLHPSPKPVGWLRMVSVVMISSCREDQKNVVGATWDTFPHPPLCTSLIQLQHPIKLDGSN